mgnify:CR=1 FL=1
MSLAQSLASTVQTLQSLTTIEPVIERASALIIKTLREGGKLLIAGNGGSAAEASHFATELTGRYFKQRRALPAIALSADGSLISCIGNDYGFDQVFARQVEGLSQSGDLFIAISSSGNSRNLVLALDAARDRSIPTIALLGRSGGPAALHADLPIVVPGESGRTAQEAHLFLIHHFCDQIDAAFD